MIFFIVFGYLVTTGVSGTFVVLTNNCIYL